jgi:hypothetical protein
MARVSTRLLNCPPLTASSRIRRDYEAAFKLTGQALSSKEGEIVLLFIPKSKDGARKPAARRKTSAR